MNTKFQHFNGVKFTRDDHTGYYLNSTLRKRMHRYVWEYYNGIIPSGMTIHHIDGDKSNNDISNLELLSRSEHATYHSNQYVKTNYTTMLKNLRENALPKAIEWHKSEQAKEFHRQLAKISINIVEELEYVCQYCGCTYKAKKRKTNRFCSNNCKSAWRRKNKIDTEERRCIVCGKSFSTNKYSKAKVCGTGCSNKLRANKS